MTKCTDCTEHIKCEMCAKLIWIDFINPKSFESLNKAMKILNTKFEKKKK